VNKTMKKVLIVPMAAMAETAGPATRCRLLAEGFRNAGLEVCTCMARDVNYTELEGIKNYKLEVPTPMGMPKISADLFFPLVQKLGLNAKKTVKSFDEVLFFTGNLDKRFIRKSVEDIQKAIRDFQPDIVYSEFNLSAFIAAKLEHVKLYATVSFPTQKEYACKPRLAKGLNELLEEWGLQRVSSALELFDRADELFCPSIPELEPFEKKVTYIGSMKNGKDPITHGANETPRDKILVYMGNGTVPARKILSEVRKAFMGSEYQIYIASKYLKPQDNGNLHVNDKWDFGKMLDSAVLFINHGGQNSIVDGLLHGVPQLMVPGKVFERIFNAGSVEKAGAGKVLPHEDFNADVIRETAEGLIASKEMRDNARELGTKLIRDGLMTIVDAINLK